MRDGLPANDLRVMSEAVRRYTQPRLLPNGKEYCYEDARTEGQQDDCAGDLEDALYLSNNSDKPAIQKVVDEAVRRAELLRNPCSWWQRNVSRRADCRL